MRNGQWRIDRSPSTRNEYRRSWFQRVRRDTINMLGGKCVKCGFSDMRALQVDHVHGDGKVDRDKTGTSLYYFIQNTIESGRYQVLCANCNVIKRFENQECPLQGKDGPNPGLNTVQDVLPGLCVKG